MAVIDDNTHFQSGIQSGTSNYMRVGETKNGKTLVQFIEYVKLTDDHVDEAKIVGDMQLDNRDLSSLCNLLNKRLKSLK